ncbi:DUF2690 domain-containing protein [Streptomyces sp. NPDC026672]|uniref:helix-turn-helix domain-containing protein n=1 Tax=unclassified Streptomyces TaxID=2593676 RepID=UPI0033C969A3
MTDPAPSAAGPACARLAEGLRELRKRTGLSMAALAGRTPYSKSSWERYLNGKQLAPRRAVEALCAMADEPAGRLMAWWELADQEWSGRALRTAPPAPPADADGRLGGGRLSDGRRGGGTPSGSSGGRGPGRRRRALVAAVCVLALAAALWALIPTTRTGDATKRAAVPSARSAPACRSGACSGRDPETMGCAMPGQVRDVGTRRRASTGALLAFRFSTRCHAAWALLWNTHVGDALEVSVPGGGAQRITVTDRYDAESSLVTPMIDGSDLSGLRACFEPSGSTHAQCFRP